jgi:hypothetical protein
MDDSADATPERRPEPSVRGSDTDRALWAPILGEDKLPSDHTLEEWMIEDKLRSAAEWDESLHPRDPDGKFTDSAGGRWSQPTDAKTGRPIPIKAKTVEDAVQLVLDGKVVEVEDVSTAHTLINRLAEQALKAKSEGKEAKDFDLCQVSVRGSNLFCAESLRTDKYPEGVPRLEMPQLGGKPIPGSEADKLPRAPGKDEVDGSANFIEHLRASGIATSRESVRADTLRASQRELIGSKVAGMMNAKSYDPSKVPVFVSRDDYVVDGHHRWAAVVGRDLEDGRLGDATMNVIRVDAPISEVLHIANAWSTKFGIAQVAGVTKQAAKIRGAAFNPDQPRDERGRWTGDSVAIDPSTLKGEPGECFRNVNRWNARHGAKTDLVVHGRITNGEGRTFDHAWIERGDKAIDPTTGVVMERDRYYALLDAKPDSKYTSTQAILNLVRAGHHGPWRSDETARPPRTAEFDPNQPRDEDGRWTDGGAAGASGSTPTDIEPVVALTEYQNYGHARVNEELRSGKTTPETSARVAAMDALMAEQKERDLYVVRGDGAGVSSALFESAGITDLNLTADSLHTEEGRAAIADLNSRMVGREFVDHAFLSTSTDPDLALDKFVPGSYSITEFGGGGLVHIVGRSKSLDVDAITGMGAGESERLLPRDTRMRVTRVDLKPHPDGKRVFLDWQMEIVR